MLYLLKCCNCCTPTIRQLCLLVTLTLWGPQAWCYGMCIIILYSQNAVATRYNIIPCNVRFLPDGPQRGSVHNLVVHAPRFSENVLCVCFYKAVVNLLSALARGIVNIDALPRKILNALILRSIRYSNFTTDGSWNCTFKCWKNSSQSHRQDEVTS